MSLNRNLVLFVLGFVDHRECNFSNVLTADYELTTCYCSLNSLKNTSERAHLVVKFLDRSSETFQKMKLCIIIFQ